MYNSFDPSDTSEGSCCIRTFRFSVANFRLIRTFTVHSVLYPKVEIFPSTLQRCSIRVAIELRVVVRTQKNGLHGFDRFSKNLLLKWRCISFRQVMLIQLQRSNSSFEVELV